MPSGVRGTEAESLTPGPELISGLVMAQSSEPTEAPAYKR